MNDTYQTTCAERLVPNKLCSTKLADQRSAANTATSFVQCHAFRESELDQPLGVDTDAVLIQLRFRRL